MTASKAARALLAVCAYQQGKTPDESVGILHAMHNRGLIEEEVLMSVLPLTVALQDDDLRSDRFTRVVINADLVFDGSLIDTIQRATVWRPTAEAAQEGEQAVARIGSLTFYWVNPETTAAPARVP